MLLILFLMSTYLALISESSLQFERLMGTTSKHWFLKFCHAPFSILLTWSRHSWWPQKPLHVLKIEVPQNEKESPTVRAPCSRLCVSEKYLLLLSLHRCSHFWFFWLQQVEVTGLNCSWSTSLQHWVPRAQSSDLFLPLFLWLCLVLCLLHTSSIFVQFHSPSCLD